MVSIKKFYLYNSFFNIYFNNSYLNYIDNELYDIN